MQSATKASPVSVLRAGDVLSGLKRQQMSLFSFFNGLPQYVDGSLKASF